MTKKQRIFMVWPAMLIAIIFGIMTIKSGSAVLFNDSDARLAAGHYIPFVLWFNFIAGFFYIIAGIALWIKQIWAYKLAMTIAALTLIVFAGLGVHILMGGNYEMRTVIAMIIRSVIWLAIAVISYKYNKFDVRN